MFCIGFLSDRTLSIELSLSGLEVPTWTCTSLLNRSLSPSVGTRGIRSLHPAERGFLVVPFIHIVAMQNRAFSVAGPRVWNGLPQELRLFARSCADALYGHLYGRCWLPIFLVFLIHIITSMFYHLLSVTCCGMSSRLIIKRRYTTLNRRNCDDKRIDS